MMTAGTMQLIAASMILPMTGLGFAKSPTSLVSASTDSLSDTTLPRNLVIVTAPSVRRSRMVRTSRSSSRMRRSWAQSIPCGGVGNDCGGKSVSSSLGTAHPFLRLARTWAAMRLSASFQAWCC